MPLTMENLENCFNQAYVSEVPFAGVKIEMEGFPEPEIIINKSENMLLKLEYYKKTYDENLNHKYALGIKITGCSYGDDFCDIQGDLY